MRFLRGGHSRASARQRDSRGTHLAVGSPHPPSRSTLRREWKCGGKVVRFRAGHSTAIGYDPKIGTVDDATSASVRVDVSYGHLRRLLSLLSAEDGDLVLVVGKRPNRWCLRRAQKLARRSGRGGDLIRWHELDQVTPKTLAEAGGLFWYDGRVVFKGFTAALIGGPGTPTVRFTTGTTTALGVLSPAHALVDSVTTWSARSGCSCSATLIAPIRTSLASRRLRSASRNAMDLPHESILRSRCCAIVTPAFWPPSRTVGRGRHALPRGHRVRNQRLGAPPFVVARAPGPRGDAPGARCRYRWSLTASARRSSAASGSRPSVGCTGSLPSSVRQMLNAAVAPMSQARPST